MPKIKFLISIMFLCSYLTVQASIFPSYIKITDEKSHSFKTWKCHNMMRMKQAAKENVDRNSTEEENLMKLGKRGVVAATKSKTLYKTRDSRYVSDKGIYKEFDARTRWPRCKTIGEVHNDGNSEYSWAYATAGAFADRMCIATNGRYNQLLSTEQLISCGGFKSSDSYFIEQYDVWNYFKNVGLVSGGKYNTNDGCQPSRVPPISNLPESINKHTCVNRCYGNSTIDYNHDHVKVSRSYSVLPENIQREVQAYGPVSVTFVVYDDFFLYKSGVYAKSEKSIITQYGNAKLIGWGVENDVDYWLLVNSWGHSWGQNGLFKIKRGTNECFIEYFVAGGVPAVN